MVTIWSPKIRMKKQIKNSKQLTLKQKTFADEYLTNGGNATQASLKVYNAKNYNTAHVIAAENLQKPTILSYIREQTNKKGVTKEFVLEKILEHFQSHNPHTRLRACELLGKYLGMFNESREVDRMKELEQIKGISWGRIES